MACVDASWGTRLLLRNCRWGDAECTLILVKTTNRFACSDLQRLGCDAVTSATAVHVQLLCKKPSLSGLDRLILSLFFIWGILSVLIGGIVGGSILTYLSPDFISRPGAHLSRKLCNLALPDLSSKPFQLAYVSDF